MLSKCYFNRDPVKNYQIAKKIILVESIQIELHKTIADIEFQRASRLLSGDINYMLTMFKSWQYAHELVKERKIARDSLQGHVVTYYGGVSDNECNLQLMTAYNAMMLTQHRLVHDYMIVRLIFGIFALASALWMSLGSSPLNYPDFTINRAIEIEEEIEGSDRSCIGYTFS